MVTASNTPAETGPDRVQEPTDVLETLDGEQSGFFTRMMELLQGANHLGFRDHAINASSEAELRQLLPDGPIADGTQESRQGILSLFLKRRLRS